MSSHRNAMLGKVHMAAKDLALTEDCYRALLSRVTGHDSAARCSEAQLDAALREFERLGWQPKARAPKRAGKRPPAPGAQAAKIRALWLSLYHLGAARDPSERALAAYARRVTGIEALQWIGPGEANRVIEGLRAWCAREGFDCPPAAPAADAKRLLVAALRARLAAAGVVLSPEPAPTTPAALDRLIERLGARVRQARAAEGRADG